MATKRKRGERWEFTVRRKGVLPKPLYLTFDSEAEGDDYVKRLEALLDRGIIPDGLLVEEKAKYETLEEAIVEYQKVTNIPSSDKRLLASLQNTIGHVQLKTINYAWVENFVQGMKRKDVLTPSTIRHYVGALARCLDWLAKKHGELLPANPLRLLARGYASYTDDDKEYLKKLEKEGREDEARDRRLSQAEEALVRNVLAGEKPPGKQRPLELRHKMALIVLFELAIESAMRLREMYTLSIDQVKFDQKTIFLEKTKNGDKRQVPMSSVACRMLKEFVQERKEGILFPWWNGDVGEKELKRVTAMLSRQFSRIFAAAGCPDLTFHDLRHEATSRIYERTTLSDLEISKITGHRDLRSLARYANLRGSNLAGHLW